MNPQSSHNRSRLARALSPVWVIALALMSVPAKTNASPRTQLSEKYVDARGAPQAPVWHRGRCQRSTRPRGWRKGKSRLGPVPRGLTHPKARRLWKLARACGAQSPNTVPRGWKLVAIGQKGCALWAPGSWRVQGAGQNITSVQRGRAGHTGFLSMAGTPSYGLRIRCSPAGVTRFVAALIQRWGCGQIRTLYFKQGTQPIAGIALPKADYIFSCTTRGVRKIGYMWVTIQGTRPLCSLMVMGFWMPTTRIRRHICSLTQIFQSISCRRKGRRWCQPPLCRHRCIKAGKRTGWCDHRGRCICR